MSAPIDEFFMVRLAALKQKPAAKSTDLSIDGETVEQQIGSVREALAPLVESMYECFDHDLMNPGY